MSDVVGVTLQEAEPEVPINIVEVLMNTELPITFKNR